MIGLSPKMIAFCELYLQYGNATKAYMMAGYKPKNEDIASANAYKLLRLEKVALYLEGLQKKVSDKRIASATEVLEYLTKVMRGEDTEQMVVVAGTGDGCSEAKVIDKELSAKDRVKASELLGKRYVLFSDRQEIREDITINVELD